MTLSPDKALSLWEVLIGNQEPTEKQQAFADKVERLYLNWLTAPDSYKETYPRYHLSYPKTPEVIERYYDK